MTDPIYAKMRVIPFVLFGLIRLTGGHPLIDVSPAQPNIDVHVVHANGTRTGGTQGQITMSLKKRAERCPFSNYQGRTRTTHILL